MALNNINLMGPNPAQPFDIQTEQARLAQLQQIAQALISQGISPTQMLDTGLVKTANWGDALGKLAETYFGRQNLDSIAGQQQNLAQMSNKMYQEDVGKVFDKLAAHPEEEASIPDLMGEGAKLGNEFGLGITKKMVPGDISSAIGQAASSLHPEVQKIAGSLMQAYMKQMVTPETIGAMVGRGNVDPKSIPAALGGTNMLMRPELLTKLPVVEHGPAGAMAGYTSTAPEGTQLKPLGTVQPPIAPVRPAGSGSEIQLPTQPTPEGTTQVVPGSAEAPDVKALNTAIGKKIDAVEESKDAGLRFIEDVPKYLDMIKLAKLAQTQGTYGSFGSELIEARKLAVRIFGFSADEANRITNFSTLMKLALTPAAHAGRQEVGGRYTQLEFINFLKAGAASGNDDPRAAMNIFQYGLLQGINHIQVHNNQLVAGLKTLPATAKFADSYRIKIDPVQLQHKISQMGIPVSWRQDNETGLWSNNLIGINPNEAVGPPAPKKMPGGFTVTTE